MKIATIYIWKKIAVNRFNLFRSFDGKESAQFVSHSLQIKTLAFGQCQRFHSSCLFVWVLMNLSYSISKQTFDLFHHLTFWLNFNWCWLFRVNKKSSFCLVWLIVIDLYVHSTRWSLLMLRRYLGTIFWHNSETDKLFDDRASNLRQPHLCLYYKLQASRVEDPFPALLIIFFPILFFFLLLWSRV